MNKKEKEGYLVQIIVLSNELLELRLDVDDLGCWELELDDRHTGFFQMFQEPDFGGLQEHQAASFAFFATGCTADSVDVVSGVIWGVELDNPVHSGDLNCQYKLKQNKSRGGPTSNPLAATSVQIKVPCLALQNSKKVLVRFCCFCCPCNSSTGRSI